LVFSSDDVQIVDDNTVYIPFFSSDDVQIVDDNTVFFLVLCLMMFDLWMTKFPTYCFSSDDVQIVDDKTVYIPNFFLFVGNEKGYKFKVRRLICKNIQYVPK
jgi:hypothetical protein